MPAKLCGAWLSLWPCLHALCLQELMAELQAELHEQAGQLAGGEAERQLLAEDLRENKVGAMRRGMQADRDIMPCIPLFVFMGVSQAAAPGRLSVQARWGCSTGGLPLSALPGRTEEAVLLCCWSDLMHHDAARASNAQ